jgi:phosphatidylserine/phosphatidylglycerophosphate/cardiolipin synthase-like enzyme
MVKLILNDQHLDSVLREVLENCRHRLFIATADVKELHVPGGAGAGATWPQTSRPRHPRTGTHRSRLRNSARSIVDVFEELGGRGIEIRLLHSGVPSGPFLGRLKKGVPDGLTMRRCPRTHIKALVADGRAMYLGSANLTGAGLGAKSARRRNFEGGIWTDEISLIDSVVDMLEEIWSGQCCKDCGRKDYCPAPLEEPEL